MLIKHTLATLIFLLTTSFASSEIVELYCESEAFLDTPEDQKAVLRDKLGASFDRIVRIDTALNLVEIKWHDEFSLPAEWIKFKASDTELSWTTSYNAQEVYGDDKMEKYVEHKYVLNRFSGKLTASGYLINYLGKEIRTTSTERCSVKKKMF